MIFVFKFDDKIKVKRKLPKALDDINKYIKFFEKNENNFFTNRELQFIFNIHDDVIIRTLINYLRVEHETPIISSNKGYLYTTDKNRIKEYVKRLNYRAFTILSAAKNLQKNIKKN